MVRRPTQRKVSALRSKNVPTKFDFIIHQLPKVDPFLTDRPRHKSNSIASASQLFMQPSLSQPLLGLIPKPDYKRTYSLPANTHCAGNEMSIDVSRTSSTLSSKSSNDGHLFYTSHCWENLGRTFSLTVSTESDIKRGQMNFGSDTADVLLPLDVAHAKSKHLLTSFCTIPMYVLIKHVKTLLTGIESTTFRFNSAHGTFEMLPDVTVDGVQTATMRQILNEFLECGTCYKRIKMLINRDGGTVRDSHEHSYMFSVRFMLI